MGNVAKIEHEEVVTTIDPMISMIERVAVNPDANVETLARMLDMKAQIDAQNAKAAFDGAFASASSEFPNIPQNGRNTHNGQSYSTLKDILTVRSVLANYGLALSFGTVESAGGLTVTAKLSHISGHTEVNSITLPLDDGPGRNKVQSIGSSQTYGQRYTAQAILGLSLGEDVEDDGRGTGKIQEEPPRKKGPTWAQTITQDLPENASPRDNAEAIAIALCNQWKRMKGVKQLFLEWDRRVELIEGLESKHPDLHEQVIDGYEIRMNELQEK